MYITIHAQEVHHIIHVSAVGMGWEGAREGRDRELTHSTCMYRSGYMMIIIPYMTHFTMHAIRLIKMVYRYVLCSTIHTVLPWSIISVIK